MEWEKLIKFNSERLGLFLLLYKCCCMLVFFFLKCFVIYIKYLKKNMKMNKIIK